MSSNPMQATPLGSSSGRSRSWWDPTGPHRLLHAMTPLRLLWVVQRLQAQGFAARQTRPCLRGLRILDVGCGGGLISHPLAQLGAQVVGIDPCPHAIDAARAQTLAQDSTLKDATLTPQGVTPNPLYLWAPGLAQDVQRGWPDQATARGPFDVVLVMDVLEHVPCVFALLAQIRTVLKPTGSVVGTTLNRTPRARLLAIGLAERMLGWVAKGTHQGDHFITPAELDWMAQKAGFAQPHIQGFGPTQWQDLPYSSWDFCASTAINYAFSFIGP